MGVRIFWIELDRFPKFSDCRLGKMANGIGAPKKNVQSGGISHGVLQVLKPLLGVGEMLGPQVGDAEKVGSFKIVIQGDSGLEIANGGWKISAVEINAAEDVLCAGVTGIAVGNGLGELAGFLDFSGAEPSYCGVDSNIGIAGGKLEGLVKFARGFVKAGFRGGKIPELPEAEGDHLVVAMLSF